MMNWAMLLLGIITYYSIGRRYQSAILIAMSLYVYWLVSQWSIVPIAIQSSVIVLSGLLIGKHPNKWLLVTAIISIILVFILLKEGVFRQKFPIGLSVVSFTGISYIVDQYREPKRYSIIYVLSYLLFFPKIFAGPIERAKSFIDVEPKDFLGKNIYTGIKYLIFAAFCKFVVGDILASTDFDSLGIGLLFQMLTFGIGFFFDFWAYTMMAIGIGYIFGYKLSVSFNKPYYAGTFKEFWHRWNITLGTWLRDYIYIPCGGNHLGLPLWCGAVLLVFIISGLWHGTTLPFIVWGVAHAGFLMIEKVIVKPRRFKAICRYCYALGVALIAALLWQLFIVDSLREFLYRFQNVFSYWHFDIFSLGQFVLCAIATVLLTLDKVFNLVRCESTSRSGIIAEVTMLTLMSATLLLMNCPLSFNFFYFRF